MNMDYCKFENTYKDLMQCLEGYPTSESEKKYAKKIFKTMINVLIEEGIIEVSTYDEEELDYYINNME